MRAGELICNYNLKNDKNNDDGVGDINNSCDNTIIIIILSCLLLSHH